MAASLALLPIASSDGDLELSDSETNRQSQKLATFSSMKGWAPTSSPLKMNWITPSLPEKAKALVTITNVDAPTVPLLPAIMGMDQSHTTLSEVPRVTGGDIDAPQTFSNNNFSESISDKGSPSTPTVFDSTSISPSAVVNSADEPLSIVFSVEQSSVVDSPQEQRADFLHELPSVADSPIEQLFIITSPAERLADVDSSDEIPSVASPSHVQMSVTDSPQQQPFGSDSLHKRFLQFTPKRSMTDSAWYQVHGRHHEELPIRKTSQLRVSHKESLHKQPSILKLPNEQLSDGQPPYELLSVVDSPHDQLLVAASSEENLKHPDSRSELSSLYDPLRPAVSDSQLSNETMSIRQNSRGMSDSEIVRDRLSRRRLAHVWLSDSETPRTQLTIRKLMHSRKSDSTSSYKRLGIRKSSQTQSDSKSPQKQLLAEQTVHPQQQTTQPQKSDSESPHKQRSVSQFVHPQQSDGESPSSWSDTISSYQRTTAADSPVDTSAQIPRIRDFLCLLQMILCSPQQLQSIMHSACPLPSDKDSPTPLSPLADSLTAKPGTVQTDSKVSSANMNYAVTCHSETEQNKSRPCNSLCTSFHPNKKAEQALIPTFLPSLPVACCTEVKWEQPSRSPSPDTSSSSELELGKIHKSLSEMLMTSSDSDSEGTSANTCPFQLSSIQDHQLVTSKKESKSLLKEKSLNRATVAMTANKCPCRLRSFTYSPPSPPLVMETPCHVLSAKDSTSHLYSIVDPLSRSTEMEQKAPLAKLCQTVTWYDETKKNTCSLCGSAGTSYFSEVKVQHPSVSELLPQLPVICHSDVKWDKQSRSSSPNVTSTPEVELAKIYSTLSQVLLTSSDSDCEETVDKFSS
ncbi:hypothetical protein chiPu_0017801 [Chiloscyllium punctatum]|uniref:Uncharacterized protein n=1 Tax=Chiloscyllium punctatum TaxID=137246 RepID=A0A401RJ20_CHIPU|nr:hypothetical protein [Chiloscyllium punctatum]